jgi:hypothetical protein
MLPDSFFEKKMNTKFFPLEKGVQNFELLL